MKSLPPLVFQAVQVSVLWFAMTRHLIVKELCSPPAWARSQNSFPHAGGGQSWALLPKVREWDRSSGRKALPSGVLSPWSGVMPKDSLAALPPHTPLIWLYRRDFSRYTFFFPILSHSPWTVSKFSRHLFQTLKEKQTPLHILRKVLFRYICIPNHWNLFPTNSIFFSSPSFSHVLRSPACGYVLIINATDIKQPHGVLNEADLTLGKHSQGREVSTKNKPRT